MPFSFAGTMRTVHVSRAKARQSEEIQLLKTSRLPLSRGDWTIEPVELVTIHKTRGDSSSILVDQSWTGRWSTIKKEREIGSSVANWTSREMTNRSGRCWSSCSLPSARLSGLEEECYRLGGLNCPNDSLCRSVRLFSCISVYNLKTIERGTWQVRRHL